MLRCVFAFGVLFITSPVLAVTLGETDTFASNTESWRQGESANLRATGGGPGGASDPYLRLVADGSGEHGKLVVFNRSQWAGNYLQSGITRISMAANNLGSTDLRLRLAFGSASDPKAGGTWFASTQPANLPAGSGWTNVSFPIDSSALTRVQGTASYQTLMAGVATLRILHASTASNQGPNVVATLGVDNITAQGAAALAGDFNSDGRVDAADYVVWRKSSNSQAGYNDWRINFGRTNAVGAELLASGAAVAAAPEPSAMLLLAVAIASIAMGKRAADWTSRF
jgi:hypothetical protein